MRLQIAKTRNIWLSISAAVIVIAVVLLATWGLRPSIDFTGGSLWQVEFVGERPLVGQVRTTISETLSDLGSVSVQTAGEQGMIVRMGFISNDQRQQLLTALDTTYGEVTEQSFESIGPVIGNELRRKSYIAIGLVLVFIVAYISFAFRQVRDASTTAWKLGLAAIVALAHDILVVCGVFVVLGHFYGVEVGTLFVTALLTVLGFSVHDTIVVFDRLRERLRNGAGTFAEKVDDSIQSTLARSINTSLTSLITLVALYIWGGDSIRHFTLALIIGMISGTYSSIFLASPLLLWWSKKK